MYDDANNNFDISLNIYTFQFYNNFSTNNQHDLSDQNPMKNNFIIINTKTNKKLWDI